MHDLVHNVLNSDEKTALRQFVSALSASGKQYLLRNEILQVFADYCQRSHKPAYFFHSSSLGTLISLTHEIILEEESTWFMLRPWIANQEVWRLGADMTHFEKLTPKALLDVRDRLVNRYQPQILEIDLKPFYEGSPTIDDPRNIGQGLTFLNRYLCNQLENEPKRWLEELFQALHKLQHGGTPLMISDRIHSGDELAEAVKKALQFVSELSPVEPFEKFRFDLQSLGFEPGWGNTASRVRETFELFNRLVSDPEPAILEAFVTRVPAIFRVVLVSIHGWVGQEGVVGRPETAGQVMYVLEQARSLEAKLREDVKLAGLDVLGIQPKVIILTRLIPNCEGTACNLRLEKLQGTENGWILRVPFADFNPNVTQNWISKFEIWPYLESFALEAERQLVAEFKGNPNLIIGNYSDGNLVAFLLSRRLKAAHCNIAHSLEKPKYLFSNLYWQDLEDRYHFSAQFTADLISMNAADFIISSSYQEIVGTPDSMGQYESYKCFTMPQLYHVVDGIDLFNPKFNMVPPGVNENIFFPYNQSEDRDREARSTIHELMFLRSDPSILGSLENPKKTPLLAVAPINSTKNLTGLAECFGKSKELQERCNLILVTSKFSPEQATHPEEAAEIEKLREIINQYNLHSHIRWVGIRLSNMELGEAYRAVADCRGIFVHFARFEAFGRTLLEAMISGLPTFATQFGGASEIIEDVDKFQINPTDYEGTAKKVLHFLYECDTNPQYWHEISTRAIDRVRNKYNWSLHSKQLLLISKIYRFWDYVTPENREARARYLETLYYLVFKPRAEKILEQHMQR
ncbi:sucrose synthase [Calothrix sp. NIES-4071]|nr:sucrose synthase [Calothrix sp. NIES-4071]BAZ63073.1 sucrose synthase [Calothrix sp. NIES-4105]